MNLLASAEKMKQEILNQRLQEKQILQEIAVVTSPEFAEQAVDILNCKKHPYDFKTYLSLLRQLRQLIYVGVPGNLALKLVQTKLPVETLIEMWKLAKEMRKLDNAGNEE